MNVDPSKPILDLADEPMKEFDDSVITVGQIIGNILSSDTETDGAMKINILAKKFYKGKKFDIDSADLALVKQVVNKAKRPAIMKGQVEEFLEDIK